MISKNIRIIIAVGRDFEDVKMLHDEMDKILDGTNPENVEIVSGKARGADRLGKLYAINRGIDIAEFPAEWREFGKMAGFIRNEKMVNYATHLVAFWDGKSSGTAHMIRFARNKGLHVDVINYIGHINQNKISER